MKKKTILAAAAMTAATLLMTAGPAFAQTSPVGGMPSYVGVGAAGTPKVTTTAKLTRQEMRTDWQQKVWANRAKALNNRIEAVVKNLTAVDKNLTMRIANQTTKQIGDVTAAQTAVTDLEKQIQIISGLSAPAAPTDATQVPAVQKQLEAARKTAWVDIAAARKALNTNLKARKTAKMTTTNTTSK